MKGTAGYLLLRFAGFPLGFAAAFLTGVGFFTSGAGFAALPFVAGFPLVTTGLAFATGFSAFGAAAAAGLPFVGLGWGAFAAPASADIRTRSKPSSAGR